MNTTDFETTDKQITERMAVEDVNAALRMIHPWMTQFHEMNDAAQRKRVLARFAEIAASKYGDPLAEAAASAAEAPTTDTLYALGYELQAKRLYSMSAAVLELAHAQAPENREVLMELVSALEQQGLYVQVYALLSQVDLGTQFLPNYLLAFNAMMLGKTDHARELLSSVLSQADDLHDVYMAGRIKRMIARADALENKLPALLTSPRGQYFVHSGGLLLAEPIAGYDTYVQIGAVMAALRITLTTWNEIPERLLTVPDKASRILSMVLSKLWDVPDEDWHGTSHNGLIVMYQSEKVISELRDILRHKASGQVFFAYTADANREHPASPEILGFRGIDHKPAWEDAPDEDDEFSIFDDTPASPPPDVIAQSILEYMPSAVHRDLTAMITFIQAYRAESETSAFDEREPLWVLPGR